MNRLVKLMSLIGGSSSFSIKSPESKDSTSSSSARGKSSSSSVKSWSPNVSYYVSSIMTARRDRLQLFYFMARDCIELRSNSRDCFKPRPISVLYSRFTLLSYWLTLATVRLWRPPLSSCERLSFCLTFESVWCARPRLLLTEWLKRRRDCRRSSDRLRESVR